MNPTYKKFLKPRRWQYLAVDSNFFIQETSLDIFDFVDCHEDIEIGNDIRLGFPELMGFEEDLNAVLTGEKESFELKGISRYTDNNAPLYIDLCVINPRHGDENETDRLMIFVEDATERMQLEQILAQRTNEAGLLLHALETSKNYIEQIISSMADALIVTETWGEVKTINKAAEKLFIYNEKEIIGEHISTIIKDKNFLELIGNNDKEKLYDKTLKDVEVLCENKNNEKIIVEFSWAAIATDIPDIYNFIYIGRDITERKRSNQRLMMQYATARVLSEARDISSAIKQIISAICETLEWTGGELWMPAANQEIEINNNQQNGSYHGNHTVLCCVEMWYQNEQELEEYIKITEQITFADGDGLPGRIWQSLSHTWITNLADDNNFLRKESAAVGIKSAFGCPIQGEGKILGVMVFFSKEIAKPDQDFTLMMTAIGNQIGQFIERKQAETALQESEQRYRDLFETASDLIQSVSTKTNHFLYVNRAWRETLEYSEQEIKNLSFNDIIHPDNKQQCQEIFRQVIAGENIGPVKAEFITKSGKKISVEGSLNCKIVDGKTVATRAIFRDITARLEAEAALRQEQEKSDRLLLNILPQPIATRLKEEQSIIAEDFGEVTVLFADIVGFTALASILSPIELVDLLNQIFSAFDKLCEQHGLEKIKTIGDAYMVVGGLPGRRADHAEAIAAIALDMQAAITQFNANNNKSFSIRIGIHSGPVVAGVIGIKKFIYDLWGDTVNTASRMESHGIPGKIQISSETYERIKHKFILEKRGNIPIKGKGEMTTYLLIDRKLQTVAVSLKMKIDN